MIVALIVTVLGIGITFLYLNACHDSVKPEQMPAKTEKTLSADEIKKQKLQEQKDLVSKYAKGELIQQVLRTICSGDPQKNYPEVIIISNESITSKIDGRIIEFNFEAHRIHNLPSAFGIGEVEYIVRPQVAMAEALNAWLDSKYTIFDNADFRYEEKTYDDGETVCWRYYSSNHVIMKLTSTLPNKSF